MSKYMDLYLSTNDSISFQDMLDIDIKAEIDTLVGGHNDLSGLNFSELPPLEMDDVHDIKWFSTNSNQSNSSLNFDFSGEDISTMVNPNAIMPVSLAQHTRSPSPVLKESHLTFSQSFEAAYESAEKEIKMKKDLMPKLVEAQEYKKPIIKTIAKVTPIIAKPAMRVTKTAAPTVLTFRNALARPLTQPITVTQVNNLTTVRTMATNTARKQQLHSNRLFDDDERIFPKPAYSYSCLIAMALKNSRSGCLPVSEIYNFMCRHFPYFKTAPNGWKNSVRHNLSLNKCFEKIEKQAVNGAQRKGCLWAMNPAKVSKMDEEVQKWSKKDPMAIKKAMVNPEHLDSLERGELKFLCAYDEADTFGDSCGSAESEEGSDSEQEVETNIDTEYEMGELIDVSAVRGDNEECSDVEVSDCVYEDMDDGKEMLRMEMALAQKALFHERTVNNKRRRTIIIQN